MRGIFKSSSSSRGKGYAVRSAYAPMPWRYSTARSPSSATRNESDTFAFFRRCGSSTGRSWSSSTNRITASTRKDYMLVGQELQGFSARGPISVCGDVRLVPGRSERFRDFAHLQLEILNESAELG